MRRVRQLEDERSCAPRHPHRAARVVNDLHIFDSVSAHKIGLEQFARKKRIIEETHICLSHDRVVGACHECVRLISHGTTSISVGQALTANDLQIYSSNGVAGRVSCLDPGKMRET